MILPPMFYIAEHYAGDNFAKELTPMISLLFSINDRGIRGSLLKKVPLLAKHLDNNSLNLSVFEPMCSGFSDSAGALRELTLKATLSLVPHLTQPNLEKLSRYLVRLQNDEETAIRTNTVYFFSKLAPHLSEMTRQKLLLPAFTRAMKDPFTPCRLAALQSTLQAKQFFDAQGVAAKVLPAVTPCCVDPDAGVRKEAFSAVEELLYILRQESERLSRLPQNGENAGATNQIPQPTAPSSGTSMNSSSHKTLPPVSGRPTSPPTATTAPAPVAPAPSSGGYFSSWMTSSSTKKPTVAPAPLPPPSLPSQPVPVPAASQRPQIPAVSQSQAGDDDGWGDDNGWDEDDNDLSAAPSPVPAPQTRSSLPVTNAMSSMKMNDDDFFGAAFAAPAKPAIMGSNKSTTGKLRVPNSNAANAKKATPKPVVQKLSADSMDDGWDDF